jgi:hypothetical protein
MYRLAPVALFCRKLSCFSIRPVCLLPRPSPASELNLLAPAIPIRISSSFARQLLPVAITLVVMMDGWSVLLALKADPQSLSFLSDLSLFVPMNWARW